MLLYVLLLLCQSIASSRDSDWVWTKISGRDARFYYEHLLPPSFIVFSLGRTCVTNREYCQQKTKKVLLINGGVNYTDVLFWSSAPDPLFDCWAVFQIQHGCLDSTLFWGHWIELPNAVQHLFLWSSDFVLLLVCNQSPELGNSSNWCLMVSNFLIIQLPLFQFQFSSSREINVPASFSQKEEKKIP